MKQVLSSVLAMIFLGAPVGAEQERKVATPIDKFNGIGRQQDFQAAIPHERKGWEALHNKQPKEAIEHFKAALAAYPNLFHAYMGLGIASERLNQLDDAQTAYRSAIKCDTNNWRPWKRLANLLYQQNKFTESRDALANAMALHPPAPAKRQMDQMIQAVEAAKRNGHADSVGIKDTGEESDN
ncbi:MAG TPA: tetratricopeptide repeat protein [Candidatus Obscuribacterales bacterium]